ncbi:MAG TPA: SAM-dependent methyltransferase [Methanospirillum sp.]|uniref:class I SAM-dependent methyltransferase n=1 Tax=Methanospirillum sp. TaxID=45200 RepID=UPI002C75FA09|nr:SAM-dependent methyltransferase [Methanospirillum sp.]HWQ65219.1 SAM-dependent methyltransferase [Methanospirillum sp.]
MMQARLVPLTDMAVLKTEPWVDQTRRPFVTAEGAYIPVREGYPSTHMLPSRRRSGRGYQKLGDVVIFHGSRPSRDEVDDIKALEKPRGIFWISRHEGAFREPKISRIEGSGGEVTHQESGIIYRLDIERVMFSQGNREEKTRISKMIHPGETVADMFAGIGYFSLGMARAGAQIHAMEINPVSFTFLEQNTSLNGLTGNIRAENGDCRDLLSGVYDRIHMGHFEAVTFLSQALRHVHKKTILHVHMLGDRSDEIKKIIHDSSLKANITMHKVKKAGPRTWHLVADVVIE